MKNIDGRDIVDDLLVLVPVPGARVGRPDERASKLALVAAAGAGRRRS